MSSHSDTIPHGARERAELAVSRDGGVYSEARELGRDVLALLAALAAFEQERDLQRRTADQALEDAHAIAHERDAADRAAATLADALEVLLSAPIKRSGLNRMRREHARAALEAYRARTKDTSDEVHPED